MMGILPMQNALAGTCADAAAIVATAGGITVRLPDRDAFEATLLAALLAAGKLAAPAAERARRLASERGETLEATLANLALVSEAELTAAIARELGLPIAGADDFPEAPVLDAAVSAKFLRTMCVLPLAATVEHVTLAMADPLNAYARRAVAMIAARAVHPVVAAPSDIRAAFERQFNPGRSQIGQLVSEMDPAAEEPGVDDVDRLRDLASEAPVIRLVNLLIDRAVERGASDVHFEPFRDRLLVRYRIDGVLQQAAEPPSGLRAAIVSRLKVMARLNIAERRLPQDGRIRFALRGRELDLRVATMPTLHGESVELRILDRANLVLDFPGLGFAPDTERALRDALARPQGILLVTGPTGSGKTTTLYAALKLLNQPGRKLFSVEDPVEYELEGVNQVQTKPEIGLGFAQVLRSALRHDPDVLMIGEIRDRETAEVAVQAALTGHLVLSTLHTNDAVSSVARLLDMGVPPYLVTATLNAALAQRLVRRLCPQCRTTAHNPSVSTALGELAFDADGMTYQPGGCDACGGTGYRGRTVIAELLLSSDMLCRQILQQADVRALRAAAAAGGMRTMLSDGLSKVAAGMTTVDEVMRVTAEA
jgi:general secretion pathway protein E